MAPRALIFDCDPGTDDAVALLMAFAHPDRLNILGVTTVGGNVPLKYTSVNGLKIAELARREDIPVFAGCDRPLVKHEYLSVEEIHGKTGLAGVNFPEPKRALETEHAVDFIIRMLMQSPKKVTLAVTGPQTNIAMALVKEPKIVSKIDEIVFMGGSITEGNITPAAEFNFFMDPHAAHVVLSSKIKMTMMGLDVTHQLVTTPERLKDIQKIGNKQSQAIFDILSFSGAYDMKRYEIDGGHIHDAVVTAFLLKPDLFSGRDCPVQVEIAGHVTMGRTLVDWYNVNNLTTNVKVMRHVDIDGFYDLLLECLKRYS
ncbi:MAG: nucleoside hydrolase [Proteobacteria bacterium]|nr:nucleoside hydrolase [Pseudomonadota bacterium]